MMNISFLLANAFKQGLLVNEIQFQSKAAKKKQFQQTKLQRHYQQTNNRSSIQPPSSLSSALANKSNLIKSKFRTTNSKRNNLQTPGPTHEIVYLRRSCRTNIVNEQNSQLVTPTYRFTHRDPYP